MPGRHPRHADHRQNRFLDAVVEVEAAAHECEAGIATTNGAARRTIRLGALGADPPGLRLSAGLRNRGADEGKRRRTTRASDLGGHYGILSKIGKKCRMSANAVGRLSGLDALRGVAALFVALNHAAFLGGHDETLVTRSYLAVDFFFMLSGFVIARTYEGRMPSPLSFAGARFVRLWPLIAIGVAIGAARSLWGSGEIGVIASQLVLALCFLPIFNGHRPLNGPAWSILFEIIANFLHSLWLRRLPRIALLILAFICALPLTLHEAMDTGQGALIWFGLPRVLMSYCIGIYIWRAYGNAPPRIPAACAYLGLPAVLMCASFFPRDFEIFIVLLCFPVILLAGLSFSTRLGPWLGVFSFPLYAVHWPVQVWLIAMGWGWQAAFCLSLLGAGVCGMVGDARFRSLALSLSRRNQPALPRAV